MSKASVGRRPNGALKSSLAELESAACTTLAVLLAFDFAGVSCQETLLSQGGFERRVHAVQGSGEAEDDGTGSVDYYISIENLAGSEFDDVLSGDEGKNYLFGGAGADMLSGLGGDDILEGGAGDDILLINLARKPAEHAHPILDAAGA